MRILSFLLFLTLPYLLFSQNTILEGIVSDSVNHPVELANVMAFNQSDTSVASFGITNSEGKYRLILPTGQMYILKSSFIGYKTWEGVISTSEDNIIRNITLKESPKVLDEVQIKYEFPITVQGDTITYKTDEFTTGNERKLGNVLEALPGFEIDENGDIKVQGKKVDKVLVEGKEFFDGNSKMATQNIPASAVENIQLLRNYNDVSPLNGLGNNESLALNVVLNEDSKNMWFGDVEAGIGLNKRYLAHPNLFYYSPKTNINIIGDANNIGEQAFTLNDYFRFSGGIRRIGKNSGSNFDLSSDEFGLSLMQNKMAKQVQSELAAVNINLRPSDKWNFTGFGILSGNTNEMETFSNRTYIKQQDDFQEVTSANILQENYSGLFKLSARFTPNYKTHIEYSAFVNASEINERTDRSSNFSSNINLFNEKNTKSPFSLEQSLALYYSINKRNILSFESYSMFKEQFPSYRLQTNTHPLANILPLPISDSYYIDQNKTIRTNLIQTELNEYFIINKLNHINFTLGLTSNAQTFESQINTIENDEILAINNTEFSNDVTYQLNNYYGGVHFKSKLGKFVVSPGANINLYQVNNTQNGNSNRNIKTLLLPDFYAKYAFGSSESLNVNYQMKASYTDIQNIAIGGVVRNYNSYFVGNNALSNMLFHDFNLNYFNYNMFNHTNIFAAINYQKKYDEINESISYQSTDRITSPNNVNFWNDNLNGNISFEKKFIGWKIKTGANASYMKFQNDIESRSNLNESINQEYNLSIESKFSNAPNFEIGMKQGWNIYSSSAIKQEYFTSSPYMDVEAPFLKYFTLAAKYEFNNYKSKDGVTSSNYDFLNATLYFRKTKSPWEFKISGKNLLNTEVIRRDGFNDNILSTYGYYVQPRYLVLSVKYDL